MCAINQPRVSPDFITFYSALTTLESADITPSKNAIIQANTFHCFNGEKDGNNSTRLFLPSPCCGRPQRRRLWARTENRFIFMLRVVKFFTAKPEQCRVLLIMY